MALHEEMTRSGEWLFRWRSYLPVLLLVLVLGVLIHAAQPGDAMGGELWRAACALVGVAGVVLRAHTVGTTARRTSGRNTRKQVADALNTTGMYSVVRHPLYVGNFLMWMSVALFPGVWWLAVIVALVFWVYYERIMYAEEEFLRARFGEQFLHWASTTPAFIPRAGQWRAPRVPFSIRVAMAREYSGLFGLVAALTAEEILWERAGEGRWEFPPLWVALFLTSATLCFTLRLLRKRTRLLHVEGR